ncbi:MAG: amidohydrolase [Bacteroidales bacterium]|nr:amidohydrolase [Bacteroidales bacterium]
MDTLKTKIAALADRYFDEIIAIRRHLHRYPELSFREFETSAYICSRLDEWGISYRKGIVKTGILAEIEGSGPGRIIAMRADMDALPINENTGLDFQSLNEGIMHACGHDVHTASLLGLIRVLSGLKDSFSGKIKFIFQPGEERIPGGAKLMLEEKLFGDEEPELVIAQHVFPDLPAGKVGFREGQYMASSDEIFITVKGKGGHAALPDTLVDPVLIASHIIVTLQQIVSRSNKPGLPTVLSFGKVDAPGAVNVIPDTVKIEGTFRTMNEEWRISAHQKIRAIAGMIAESMGGQAEVEIRGGYPVLVNDPELTRKLRSFAIEFLGAENVEDLDIRMTAEDFSYFSQQYPASLFRLGVTEPGSVSTALHTPTFRVDETAIKTAVGLMAWMVINLMKE